MSSFPFARALLALALTGVALAFGLAPSGCLGDPSFAGGAGGAQAGAGGAAPAPCQTPEDCSGDETDCVHRTCTAGQCGLDYAAEGFLVGAQATGDCAKTVCNGKGGIETVPDDVDKPNDGNDCTMDVCTAGKPSHPPVPKGAACGATQKLSCDGAGSCTGCMAAADCGADAACVSYACSASACKVDYVPAGTGDSGNQVMGDCKKNVCNGAGGPAKVNDETDVPKDGDPCTLDLCSMGQPSHSTAPVGTSCGGSSKCDVNGTCVGCITNADCGAGFGCKVKVCKAGSCQSANAPNGTGCNDGVDCTINDTCSNGGCSGNTAPAGTPCGGGICDDAQTCCSPNYGSIGTTQLPTGVLMGPYVFHAGWCTIGSPSLPAGCYSGTYIYSQSLISSSCFMTGSNGLCTDQDAIWNVQCAQTVRCTYDCQGNCNVDSC